MSWISEKEIISLIKAKYSLHHNDAQIPQDLLNTELAKFEKRDKVDGDPNITEIEWEYYFDPE